MPNMGSFGEIPAEEVEEIEEETEQTQHPEPEEETEEEETPFEPPEHLRDLLAEGAKICSVCGGQGAVFFKPQQDPGKERCEACDGYGLTLTGSRDPDAALAGCSACGGSGWRSKVTAFEPPPFQPRVDGEKAEEISPDFASQLERLAAAPAPVLPEA